MTQKYSGVSLCGQHLISDIEMKGKYCIRQEKGIVPRSTIALATGGGVASLSLLVLLSKILLKRNDIRFIVISIVGQVLENSEKSWLNDYCGKNAIEIFFHKRDDIKYSLLSELTHFAEIHNARKVALGLTLDDFAFDMLKETFLLEPEYFGFKEKNSLFIAPFQAIPFEEISIYNSIMEINPDSFQKRNKAELMESDEFIRDIESLLNQYSEKHPSTPFALLGLRRSLSLLAGNKIKPENPNNN